MSELLGEVNRRIRDLAAKVDPDDSSAWEFVCECGEDGCSERVGLPLARYDDLRDADVALLAPGHPEGVPLRPREIALGLVRSELVGLGVSLNGSGAHQEPPQPTNGAAATAEPSTRRCRSCSRVLPAPAFAEHCHQCRDCRRAQEREREQRRRREAVAAEDDGDQGLDRA
jgi:hypothetical protein